MPDDISPTGWLVILCALALGFGLVRFSIEALRNKMERGGAAESRKPSSESGFRANGGSGPFGEQDASNERTNRSNQSGGPSQEKKSVPKAWNDVLDVTLDASLEEIRKAYKKKIGQYHPDKVSGLGPEFTVIAERMAKEINDAYEVGKSLRR